jgi:hypothetical protein
MHFHCVVIDTAFDSAAVRGSSSMPPRGLDEQAFAEVQERVRRRLLRAFTQRLLRTSWPSLR